MRQSWTPAEYLVVHIGCAMMDNSKVRWISPSRLSCVTCMHVISKLRFTELCFPARVQKFILTNDPEHYIKIIVNCQDLKFYLQLTLFQSVPNVVHVAD